MNQTLTRKEVRAKKEYSDSCQEHLEFGLIKKEAGKWLVELEEAKDIGISEEDIKVVQESCDKNFRILPGERHTYQSGVYDNEFYTARYNTKLAAIITKYDLWYED